MKILLISDVHGNLEGLTTFLQNAKQNHKNIDRINMLGDIVGYMTNPNECIDLVKNYDCIKGNHDFAAYDPLEIGYFNKYAYKSMLWTKNHLTNKSIEFLKGLPYVREYINENYIICHGDIRQPKKFKYVNYLIQVKYILDFIKEDICFVGHSHVPFLISKNKNTNKIKNHVIEYNHKILLNKDYKYCINVGSIGQPRDGNPKSCGLIYDTKEYSITFLRSSYNIEQVVNKMIKEKMPYILSERLYIGK